MVSLVVEVGALVDVVPVVEDEVGLTKPVTARGAFHEAVGVDNISVVDVGLPLGLCVVGGSTEEFDNSL
jgi:hypothetical protein